MDSGVVANLEAEANRLRAEVVSVIEGLGLLGPEADELAAEEAIFLERRSETLQTIEGMGSVTTAASAALTLRAGITFGARLVQRPSPSRYRRAYTPAGTADGSPITVRATSGCNRSSMT